MFASRANSRIYLCYVKCPTVVSLSLLLEAIFLWTAFGLRKVKSITPNSQTASTIVMEMPLFEEETVLAGTLCLDLPKFSLICMLNPASSMKTQLLCQSISLSPIHSSTFSLLWFKVLSDVLATTIVSNFLRVREACWTICLWRPKILIDCISGKRRAMQLLPPTKQR